MTPYVFLLVYEKGGECMATKTDIDVLIYSLLKHAQQNHAYQIFLPCYEHIQLTNQHIKHINLSYQPQTTPSIDINNIKYNVDSAFSVMDKTITWIADNEHGGFDLDNELSDEITIVYHTLLSIQQLRIFRKNTIPSESYHHYGDLCFFKQPLSDDFIGWACISNQIDADNIYQLKLSDFDNIPRIEKEQ